ncbi:MAG: hypothetical protein AB7K24_08720 [Gemmataceae bacterium]
MQSLINELGHPEFDRRESATRALEKVGVPALEQLRAAAARGDLELRRRAEQIIERIENTLEGVALFYRDCELPVPRKQAPFVLYRRAHSETFEAGFLIRPPNAREDGEVLLGLHRVRVGKIEGARPVLFILDIRRAARPELERWRQDVPPGECLILAIQCQLLGEERLASVFWEKGCGESPRRGLIDFVWHDCVSGLTSVSDNRTSLAQHMHTLIARDRSLDTKENRELLVSLDKALVPSQARPGSVEAMIDDLVNDHTSVSEFKRFMLIGDDERHERLRRQGFDAIPLLINHLDDDRLTRGQHYASKHWPAYHRRVRDVVSDILVQLAPDRNNWRRVGHAYAKQDVQAWWEKTRKLGEEQYARQHLITDIGCEWVVRSSMLEILARKFPARLPEVYRSIMADPRQISSGQVAEAIVASNLTREKKFALLSEGAQHSDERHRLAALKQLKTLEPAR